MESRTRTSRGGDDDPKKQTSRNERRSRSRSRSPRKSKRRDSSSSASSGSVSKSPRRSSSSSSSPSADKREKKLRKLEKKEKKRQKREEKRLKKLRKLHETEEEKEQRRKEKAKSRIPVVDLETFGYSGTDNRFGDPNLHEPFVWKKKVDKLKSEGKKIEKLTPEQKIQRQKEIAMEIEKSKQRREEYELEKEMMERERARIARERDSSQYQDFEKKEEQFHLEQAFMRSELRIREGRARPIDLISRNLNPNSTFEPDVNEPYRIFHGLNLKDMEELKIDIRAQLELGDRPEFWRAMLIVCDDEMSKLSEEQTVRRIQPDILRDIEIDLSEKNYSQLLNEEREIRDKKIQDDNVTDLEFYEEYLKILEVFKAKAKLREIHAEILRHHLQRIQSGALTFQEDPKADQRNLLVKLPPAPVPIPAQNRHGDVNEHGQYTEQELYDKEANEEMDEDEATFNIDVPLNEQVYSWQDKWRPRKPKYFNRVHTGYEWNRYNQSHYDTDNPPPKIVQGYKFNIFYPDLIDKSVTPKYFLEPVPGEPEVCYIRFHAGPPYEDIAFKIVNRPWELSHRKGMRNTFERGVLQLWFNFRRFRYRA